MGEISEMMLDGTLCEGCGEYIGSDNGYPTYCSPECAGDRGAGDAQIHQDLAEGETKSQKRNRKKKRRQENYREMQSLLQKTVNIIEGIMESGEFNKGELNNHKQAIEARLMRVR